jgi:phage/plasmid primase-like uncharacterized protein
MSSANDSRLLNAEDERQFLAAMHCRDLALESGKRLIANGEWQACTVVSKGRAGKSDGRYVLHAEGPAPWGLYHNWTDGKDPDHWRGGRQRNLTEAELEELEIRLEEERTEHERIAAKEAEEAVRDAKNRWERGKAAAASHPYLERKKIEPHGVRVDRFGTLLVPMYSPESKTPVNIQFIAPDGTKWFLRGGRVKGCFYRIAGGNPNRVQVVEGFATGATVAEATDNNVAVAFNAGNLAAVASMIRRELATIDDSIWRAHEETAAARDLRHEHREHFVDTKVTIAADDDWKTEANPGIMKGLAAAREAKALIAIPDFGKDRAEKDTDFNDLANRYNLDAVEEDIANAVEPAVLFEKRLIEAPQSAHSDANIKELAAWKQYDAVVYERIRARLKDKGRANIRELDKAVKARIEHEQDAAKVSARRHQVEKVDIKALQRSAQQIIDCSEVLEKFAAHIGKRVAGEARLVKLAYLGATSRLFSKAMHIAFKGTSSGGKSEIRKRVLEYFPPESIISFTATSERALLFMQDDFQHKIISMGEAFSGEELKFQDYLLRELMSENMLRYPIAQKVGDQIVTIDIVKHGPVCFMVTTTRNRLNPENETRLLPLEIDDSPKQTQAVMRMVADAEGYNMVANDSDLDPWRDFQRLLAAGNCTVIVPFSRTLMRLIPPKAVRLRRDTAQLMRAVKAHALIHYTHRRSKDGAIVATLADYEAVLPLMNEVLATSVEVRVRDAIVDTIEAVEACEGHNSTVGASVRMIAERLRIDRSAAWRRVNAAVDGGYLINLETRRGQPGQYRTTGERMPNVDILPTVEVLREALEQRRRNAPANAHRARHQND